MDLDSMPSARPTVCGRPGANGMRLDNPASHMGEPVVFEAAAAAAPAQAIPAALELAEALHTVDDEPADLVLDILEVLHARAERQKPPKLSTSAPRARAANILASLTAAYRLDMNVFFTSLAFHDAHSLEAESAVDFDTFTLACFTMAAKMEEEERKIPLASGLLRHALVYGISHRITPRSLMDMELWLMKTRNWNMCVTTPKHFVDVYARCSATGDDRIASQSIVIKHAVRSTADLAEAFLCTASVEIAFSGYSASKLAASAVACARHELRIDPIWPASLQACTGFDEKELTAPFHFLYSVGLAARKAEAAAMARKVQPQYSHFPQHQHTQQQQQQQQQQQAQKFATESPTGVADANMFMLSQHNHGSSPPSTYHPAPQGLGGFNSTYA